MLGFSIGPLLGGALTHVTGWFFVVERIAPDQPPARHRIAGGQLDFGNGRPRRSEKLRDRQVVRPRLGGNPMKRRDFIAGLAGAMTCLLAARGMGERAV
jgi:hypothetical protein